MSNEFYTLSVVDKVAEGSKAVSIVFDVPEELKSKFAYKSGQYLTIKADINGESVRRAYSLSSYPGDGNRLQVSSKMVEQGKMSVYLFRDLKVGDQLEVMPPMGNFTLESSVSNLVLFAAGSGITPLLSILKTALDSSIENIDLIYANRSEEEAMFLQELKDLEANNSKLNIQWLWSSAGNRIDSSVVQKVVRGKSNLSQAVDYFICGPVGMINTVEAALQESGISKEHIHIEYFASPKSEDNVTSSPVELSGEVNEITLLLDDEKHEISMQPKETILEAAERIGIDPPFSCRSGVCTTCMAKVMQGEVQMENNFGLGQDEIDEGFVLTCISTPKTPGVIVSWDE